MIMEPELAPKLFLFYLGPDNNIITTKKNYYAYIALALRAIE